MSFKIDEFMARSFLNLLLKYTSNFISSPNIPLVVEKCSRFVYKIVDNNLVCSESTLGSLHLECVTIQLIGQHENDGSSGTNTVRK